MVRNSRTLVLAFAVSLAAFLAACGGGGSSDNVVRVKLGNWFMEPDAVQLTAGNVTFRAVHEEMEHGAHGVSAAGAIHELVVARKQPDGTFKSVGSVGDIAAGKSKDVNVTLEPGEYELQCNLTDTVDGQKVSHYAEGMHVRLTVS